MLKIISGIKYLLSFSLVSVLISCTSNTPYHTENHLEDTNTVSGEIKPAGIQHNADGSEYDLAFVEYTDRGNVFSREQLNNVLEHVKEHAEGELGTTVITYIHGWKHNSSENDSNLRDFKKLLSTVNSAGLTDNRKLIGIYIGWRGLSLELPGLKNLTYWERKRVAHDIGKGGITELLLRLEKTLYSKKYPSTKNILVNSGHSMGGAILLSALNDVLMDRLLDITERKGECVKTRPFGHSNLLINPAVEANEIFQLKELVEQNECYDDNQAKLLHTISSDADRANKVAFKIGQWLGVNLKRKQTKLERKYHDKEYSFHEKKLDITTIANYPYFRTGKSISHSSKEMSDEEKRHCSQIKQKHPNTDECYIACKGGHECVDQGDKKNHIPVVSNEPLSFVYTDKNFMGNHTDIFNANVAGYLTTITEEAQYNRKDEITKKQGVGSPKVHDMCMKEDKFNFPKCFQFFKNIFKKSEESKKPK